MQGLFDLMREKDMLQDRPGAKDIMPLKRAIKVKHLSFQYEPISQESAVLKKKKQDTKPPAIPRGRRTRVYHKTNNMFSLSTNPIGIKRALDGVTLKIKKGTTTGLVGRSGAGKSTLVNILLRFYDPCEGFIKWDSINLRDTTAASLRSNISVVPQEVTPPHPQ